MGMDADDLEVLKWLTDDKENLEIYRERTYSVERRRGPMGTPTHTVQVTIRRAGPDGDPKLRYACKAQSLSTFKEASGNPGSTLYEALRNVHWQDLD
jgi:hypothetical protein